MSVEAISWALSQPIDRSSTKFVLVAMANCASADMLCWPSASYLCEATSQDRKTITENLRRLREAGYIEPTEDRRGATGQVVVYRLKTPENGAVKQAQKRNSSENGPGPKTDDNRPENGQEDPQKRTETGPKTGDGTVRNHKEPSRNQKTTAPQCVAVGILVAAGFDEATAAEFIAHKTRLKAPLTERAWRDHLSQAAKAGWSPMAAAEKVMAKSWKGFEAKYVEGEKLPAKNDAFAGAI